MHATPLVPPELESQLARLRRTATESGVPTLDERLDRLQRLKDALLDNRDRFVEAVSSDFGVRSKHETLMADILTVVRGIDDTRRSLRTWMRPRRVGVSWIYRPARARVRPQPKGVVGVMGAWNYPVNLVFAPAAAALAAGNRLMVKPSEHTPRTADLTKAVLEDALGSDWVAVVLGGPDVGAAFSRLPFDHLLFTGSTAAGRKIMAAASENLVPLTLELGGKSPVIVTEDRFGSSALRRTANSIAFAKLLNAGQTCIAPDYVFVPEGRADDFVDAFRRSVEGMYPTLLDNPDYTAIINEAHFARLQGYLEQARERGARLVTINPGDEDLSGQSKKFVPTLVVDPVDDLAVMQEEIFGPILPVKTYSSLDQALQFINARPRPLALYVYSDDARKVRRVVDGTTSGGVCINEATLQFAEEHLPFGGIGASGMGAYHGETGFETFSHLKPIFERTRLDPMSMFRPPFGSRHERLLAWLFGR